MKSVSRFGSLLALVFLVACADAETKSIKEAKQVSVEVIELRKQSRAEVIRLLGTVEAKCEVKLAFKTGGKVRNLSFEEGEQVKAGAALAQLDTIELLARKEKALENKNKARRDLNRMERLYRQHIVPQASYEDTRSLLISAEAELRIVEDNLKHSVIKAPFTGRITKKLSEVGEIVSPGMPVAVLTQMDPILVKAAVPDKLMGKVKTRQTVHVTVDSHPHRRFTGLVHKLETTADPLSRTFRMEIRLANPGEMLRPGLIAKVEILREEGPHRIFIPLESVLGFGVSPSVFVVKDQMAERRMIKMGRIVGEETEVLEGLVEGEMLVVIGQEYLKERQQVLTQRQEPREG
jgi:RND family efflux transporter MFP subunit